MAEFHDRSKGVKWEHLDCEFPNCGNPATHFVSHALTDVPDSDNRVIPMCESCANRTVESINARTPLVYDPANPKRGNKKSLLNEHGLVPRVRGDKPLTDAEKKERRAAQNKTHNPRRRSETAQLMDRLDQRNSAGNLRGMSTPVTTGGPKHDMMGWEGEDVNKRVHLEEAKSRRTPAQRRMMLKDALRHTKRQPDGSYKNTKRLSPPPGHKKGPYLDDVLEAMQPEMEKVNQGYDRMARRASNYSGPVSNSNDVPFRFRGSEIGSHREEATVAPPKPEKPKAEKKPKTEKAPKAKKESPAQDWGADTQSLIDHHWRMYEHHTKLGNEYQAAQHVEALGNLQNSLKNKS